MTKKDRLKAFNNSISLYDCLIEKSLSELDFTSARNWYAEMRGAFLLAEALKLVDSAESHKIQDEWFQRIQDAQFGSRRKSHHGLAEKK